MVVQGRNLRPGWPLALVGLAGLAALPALAVRIPLQTLQVAEIVAIALVPVSFLLLSSTGLNRQMALLGIGLLGAVFAQNTPAFALLWIVVGAAGAFCPRLDSRMTGRFARLELFSHGSLVATVLIGAIAARPFLLEVLVWCLYGDRMNVIPFQRA